MLPNDRSTLTLLGDMVTVTVDLSANVNVNSPDVGVAGSVSASASTTQSLGGYMFWQAYPAALFSFLATLLLFKRSLMIWVCIPLLCGGLLMVWFSQDVTSVWNEHFTQITSSTPHGAEGIRGSGSLESNLSNETPMQAAIWFFFVSILMVLSLHGFYRRFISEPASSAAGAQPSSQSGQHAEEGTESTPPDSVVANSAQSTQPAMSLKSIANIGMGLIVLGILAWTFLNN